MCTFQPTKCIIWYSCAKTVILCTITIKIVQNCLLLIIMSFRFDKLRKGFIFGAVFNLYYCRKHSHLLLIHKRMEQVFSYIIGLGAAVMMPIIFTILGVCIGIKFSKALKSGFVGRCWFSLVYQWLPHF